MTTPVLKTVAVHFRHANQKQLRLVVGTDGADEAPAPIRIGRYLNGRIEGVTAGTDGELSSACVGGVVGAGVRTELRVLLARVEFLERAEQRVRTELRVLLARVGLLERAEQRVRTER